MTDNDAKTMTHAGADGHEPAAVSMASFSDPHMQPLAKNPRRAEMIIGICMFIGLLGFAAFGALYWQGGQTQLEGVYLGVGLFGFGFGMSAWGKYLLPAGPFAEERHSFRSTDEERAAMTAAVEERAQMVVRRRGFPRHPARGGFSRHGGGDRLPLVAVPRPYAGQEPRRHRLETGNAPRRPHRSGHPPCRPRDRGAH